MRAHQQTKQEYHARHKRGVGGTTTQRKKRQRNTCCHKNGKCEQTYVLWRLKNVCLVSCDAFNHPVQRVNCAGFSQLWSPCYVSVWHFLAPSRQGCLEQLSPALKSTFRPLFGLGGSGLRCGSCSTKRTRVLGAAFCLRCGCCSTKRARVRGQLLPAFKALSGLFPGLGGSGLRCGCCSTKRARVLREQLSPALKSTFRPLFGLGGSGLRCGEL